MGRTLGDLVERVIDLAAAQDEMTRGQVTWREQRKRMDEIFALRREFKSDPERYADLLDFTDNVLRYENFSLSIPIGVSVTPAAQLKSKRYETEHGTELRTYWCPHFGARDNDGISVVYAITPPSYCQPLHLHLQTDEHTLALNGNMTLRTRIGCENQDHDVQRGSLAISRTGLAHTILNRSSDHSSPNISIKLPESLEDRFDLPPNGECDLHAEGAELREPTIQETSDYRAFEHGVEDLGYRYTVRLYDLMPGRTIDSIPESASEFYFMTGGSARVRGPFNELREAERSSLIVVDPGYSARITAGPSGASIYTVELEGSPVLDRG